MAAPFEVETEHECVICFGPMLPYVTLSPCGHALCGACAPQVAECPQCRVPVERRIENPQLFDVISNALRYRCTREGCGFVGTAAERDEHACGALFLRFRELGRGSGWTDKRLAEFLAPYSEDTDEGVIVDALLQAVQCEQNGVAAAVPSSPSRRTVILWDYENILPARCGVNEIGFVGGLTKYLKRKSLIDDVGRWELHAFLPAHMRAQHAAAVESLNKIGVNVVCTSGKREGADRALAARLREDVSCPDRRVVLLSDDGDFVMNVVEAKRDHPHCEVHVVHCARPGTDHELRLGLHPDSAVAAADIFPGFVSNSPQPPAPNAGEDSAASVLVAGRRVPVALLRRTRQIPFLLHNPNLEGQFCRYDAGQQGGLCNREDCTFVHKRYVKVSGRDAALVDLVDNAARRYLVANPGKEGKFCMHKVQCRDGAGCKFIHRIANRPINRAAPRPPAPTAVPASQAPPTAVPASQAPPTAVPASQARAVAPAPRAPAVAAPASQAPPTAATVLVDGRRVPLQSLVPNRAAQAARAHPGLRMSFCKHGASCRDPTRCAFVHCYCRYGTSCRDADCKYVHVQET